MSRDVDSSQVKTWQPAPHSKWSTVGRLMSIGAYIPLAPFALTSRWLGGATAANARIWSVAFTCLGLIGVVPHVVMCRRAKSPLSLQHILAQGAFFLTWTHPFLWFGLITHKLVDIFSLDRAENRLQKPGGLYGSKVLVVGNGPSALEGEQRGDEIDKFDEVVRFNNFQTKVAGMLKWVGTKTTVHFSDGVLFPTYQEYHVPGATVMLSLIMDNVMVAGSYMLMRFAADLQPVMTMRFMMDPQVRWIEKSSIERLKKALGCSHVKHPTSGMLAIDYFVRKEGVKLPVYIHGFDFFMGPTMHYYTEQEPWYERINDRLGVNMHSPHLEKIYVEKLIAEGKVCFLKDMK